MPSSISQYLHQHTNILKEHLHQEVNNLKEYVYQDINTLYITLYDVNILSLRTIATEA